MDELTDAAGIEELVQELLDSADAPGAAVALIVDGYSWSAGVGSATIDGAQPLDASARFSAYSGTKTVIATIVMQLVESRAMSLDDAISDHLPGLPLEAPVTIRQVLNHTGGLPDYGSLAEYHDAIRDSPEAPWTSDHFLAKTLGKGRLFEPGQGWHYSNMGYMVLRLMIERATGLSFRDAVLEHVAKPYELHELAVVDRVEDNSILTPGYSGILHQDRNLENVIPRYHPGWVSHGLVTSTAVELARFIDMLFRGQIVNAKSVDIMLTAVPVRHTHPWMGKPSYGFGLMIDPFNRFGVVAGHTGGGPGYSAAAYHFPKVEGHSVTSVALVNRDGSDLATDIVFSIVERFERFL